MTTKTFPPEPPRRPIRLRAIRRALGLTQFRLAQLAQIPASDLSSAETGRLRLGPARRKRIATVLGEDEAVLFAVEESR